MSKVISTAIGIGILSFLLCAPAKAENVFLKGIQLVDVVVEDYDKQNCGATTSTLQSEAEYILGRDLKITPIGESQCYVYVSPAAWDAGFQDLCYGAIRIEVTCPIDGKVITTGTSGFESLQVWRKSMSIIFPRSKADGYKEEILQKLLKLFIIDWRKANQ